MSHSNSSAPIVATYYYPGWYRASARTIRGCAGGTEWDLLFDDVAVHAYPDVRRPLAGPVEPTIETLEVECRTAAAAGIDAFIWCWYWDHGTLMFNETLEMFLQCRVPVGFKYALMWVNKRPHYRLPLTRTSERQVRERVVTTDEHDFRLMVEYLAVRHWSRPDYLFAHGRPTLLLFHVDLLVNQLGAARLQRLLLIGNDIARQAGFAGIEYVAIVHKPWPIWRHASDSGSGADDVPLRRVGFRAVSNYVYLPDWSGPPLQHYPVLVGRRAAEWPILARQHELPLWPSVSVGWDGRPRGTPEHTARPGYPWSPRVMGETPGEFARALRLWRRFADRSGDVPILPIASWNEWTEGHAVAPCDRHGSGMLDAVREFKKTFAEDPPESDQSTCEAPSR